MNRYYGNFHRSGGRRDSLTFANGPLSPIGPGRNQSGGTPLQQAVRGREQESAVIDECGEEPAQFSPDRDEMTSLKHLTTNRKLFFPVFLAKFVFPHEGRVRPSFMYDYYIISGTAWP